MLPCQTRQKAAQSEKTQRNSRIGREEVSKGTSYLLHELFTIPLTRGCINSKPLGQARALKFMEAMRQQVRQLQPFVGNLLAMLIAES